MYNKTPDWARRNLISTENIVEVTKNLPYREELTIPLLELLLKESKVVKRVGDFYLINRISDIVDTLVYNKFIISLEHLPVLLRLIDSMYIPGSPGHQRWETAILARLEEETPNLFLPLTGNNSGGEEGRNERMLTE